MALIKCSECGKEISKKAIICPHCGYQSKKLKKRGCLFSFLLFIIFICIGITVMLNTDSAIQKGVSGVKDSSEYITAKEFSKIKEGMTYDEVVKIIGSKGELTSSSSLGDFKIEIYTWYGNGFSGSNANVTFQNDKVTAKAQVGLK